MIITIDKAAGFCPGVKRAIQKAEESLGREKKFYSLGSLLHNEIEMGRLGEMGLKIVSIADIPGLAGEKLLFRAHGEPPETYELTEKNRVEVIDATCAVVRQLQKKIEAAGEDMEKVGGQVVIFGKIDHPEVIGLLGQTKGLCVVIRSAQDLSKVDLTKPIRLFSQTTMDEVGFELISDAIKNQLSKISSDPDFVSNKSICQHVLKRVPHLKEFASQHEVIIFVSGRESSNGKKLFRISTEVNPESYFITESKELNPDWFIKVKSVGISGAASTPQWLMEEVAAKIQDIS